MTTEEYKAYEEKFLERATEYCEIKSQDKIDGQDYKIALAEGSIFDKERCRTSYEKELLAYNKYYIDFEYEQYFSGCYSKFHSCHIQIPTEAIDLEEDEFEKLNTKIKKKNQEYYFKNKIREIFTKIEATLREIYIQHNHIIESANFFEYSIDEKEIDRKIEEKIEDIKNLYASEINEADQSLLDEIKIEFSNSNYFQSKIKKDSFMSFFKKENYEQQ